MELNLLPEDIDKIIRETIIKSALGKNIQSVIDKAVSNAIDGYNNPICSLVNQVVGEIVKDHLHKPENKALIVEAIIEKIKPDTIKDMLDYGAQRLREYTQTYRD